LRGRYAFLVANPLFDAVWYVKSYPDVATFEGGDALTHYLLHGFTERRSPGPLFDEAWYNHKYVDVATSNIDGLTHYLRYGAAEGRDPNPLFDSAWYRAQTGGIDSSGLDPLTHYMRIGHRLGLSPSPLLNVDWYSENAPDLAASGLDPISHYYTSNARDTRSPNPFFDAKWYLGRNKDAAVAAMDPFSHYLLHGARRGASPSAFFDIQWYRKSNPDVDRIGVEPLTHFLRHGAMEGRDPNPFFDTNWYVKRYAKGMDANMAPAERYLRRGVVKGENPNAMFNSMWYRKTFMAPGSETLDPLAHYIENGIHRGYVTAPALERPTRVKFAKTINGPIYQELKLSAWGETSWRDTRVLRFDFDALDINRTNIRAQRDNMIWRRPLRELMIGDAAFLVEPFAGAELWLEVRNPPSPAARAAPVLHARLLTAMEKLALRYEANEVMARFNLAPVAAYQNWRDLYDIFDQRERDAASAHISRLPYQPLISIVTPVFNTETSVLIEMLTSVKQQVYTNWELCIADDGSTVSHVRAILEVAASAEPRIKLCFRERNGHISEASNSALELVEGDYIAFLDHDDLLAPHALAMMAIEINNRPEAEIFYSDHDQIDARGELFNPYFKPEWNPELLLGQNYLNHLCVYSTRLIRSIGGFRVGFEGSQDYDLLLRAVNATAGPVVHIPHVLYHWRAYGGSQSFSDSSLDRATLAARRAIKESCAERGEAVDVVPATAGYHHVVAADVSQWPKVSVIIPTRDHADDLREVMRGLLEKTDYPDLEIIIADNESSDEETLSYFEDIKKKGVLILPAPGPFNFSKINNDAARIASGDILLFLNNDISMIAPGWLKEMVRYARKPDVGAVGAKLRYPDGALQHGGVVLGIGGVAGHIHCGVAAGDNGYFSRLALTQEVACVTGACLATKKSLFEALGGFNETQLKIAFNDVDLCMRIRRAGYRIIWTPFAELTHHESKSRGLDTVTEERRKRFEGETAYMRSKWGPLLDSDPFYSPNLSLRSIHPEYAAPPRTRRPWARVEQPAKQPEFAWDSTWKVEA
jgi:GT2 family glycosyltransferase